MHVCINTCDLKIIRGPLFDELRWRAADLWLNYGHARKREECRERESRRLATGSGRCTEDESAAELFIIPLLVLDWPSKHAGASCCLLSVRYFRNMLSGMWLGSGGERAKDKEMVNGK